MTCRLILPAHERTVCRVLSSRIRKLLNRLDRELLEDFLPSRVRRRGEVAVYPLDSGFPKSGDLSEQSFDHCCLCIVRIDEDGQSQRLVVGFESLQWSPRSQDRISGCRRLLTWNHTGVAEDALLRKLIVRLRVSMLLEPGRRTRGSRWPGSHRGWGESYRGAPAVSRRAERPGCR